MRKRKININKIRPNYFMFLFTILLFSIFIIRILYLCLVDYKVLDTTISDFIKQRNTEEEVLMPTRGSILDKNGNILAEDVASYSIIAYLNPSRSINSIIPQHVVDINYTAEALAPLIDTDVNTLIGYLSKDLYQVELGSGSRNLSQIKMEEIKALNLPGIDFVASTKRYYPNGDFASYMIGYTINEEDIDGNIWKVGGLGLEQYYNENLTGRSGYIAYEKDRNGYKILNGREYIEEEVDGEDIYLTLDNNIQLFTENAVKKMVGDSEGEWGMMVVADAKTGAILSYATAPSFDPNKKDITNYVDLLTGTTYEPGSTMKIFSYLCSINSGNYDGSKTYDSGTIEYETNSGGKIVIHDWNKIGWGNITYDYGFAMSSNVGAAGLLRNEMLDKKSLKSCYTDYGFGQTTGFSLNREAKGSIKFNYEIDVASATFGQAITITPIQMIQALTMISNDGKILKPYVVDKIIDPNTNEVTYESTKEILDVVATSESVTKIKELMSSVVCNNPSLCTGSAYYMDGYPIMGKTGTAQIYDETTGTYMIGESDYIYSFAGLYPSNDPSIIIYTVLKRPKDTTNYVSVAVKDVIVNTSKYLNIKTEDNNTTKYELPNYINKNTNSVLNNLTENNMKIFVIGDGDTVINQYPSKGTLLYKNSVVAILTNNNNKVVPNLTGLSYKDAYNILKLMNVKFSFNGNGYVIGQSIPENTVITDDMELVITLGK